MTKPTLNHVAISMHPSVLDEQGRVESLAELHEIVGRAKAYAERDDRVEIIDVHGRTTHGSTHDYVLTSAYLGYLLPLMIELQHLQPLPR